MEACLLERMQGARGSLRSVLVPTGTMVQLVGPSTIRGSLTLFGAADAYTVSTREFASLTDGIAIPKESATPVVLSLQFHGDLVQQCFYVRAVTSITVTYVETIFQGP